MIVLSLALVVFACLLTSCVSYLLALAGVFFFVPNLRVPRVPPEKRFSVLIPAHDEEFIIATSLQSWLQVDYPKEKFQLHVIADNCTDRTIEIARSLGPLCGIVRTMRIGERGRPWRGPCRRLICHRRMPW